MLPVGATASRPGLSPGRRTRLFKAHTTTEPNAASAVPSSDAGTTSGASPAAGPKPPRSSTRSSRPRPRRRAGAPSRRRGHRGATRRSQARIASGVNTGQGEHLPSSWAQVSGRTAGGDRKPSRVSSRYLFSANSSVSAASGRAVPARPAPSQRPSPLPPAKTITTPHSSHDGARRRHTSVTHQGCRDGRG